MTATKKRSLVVLLFSVAMLSMSLFAASPSDATTTQGHFQGGDINIGNGTILVDIDDCTPLFATPKSGDTATGTFHCQDIDATGPLGDALVDLLCTVTWEWPVAEGSHAAFNCSMHIFIETFLGDFLCNAAGSWLTVDTDGSHWFIANAAPGFGNVPVTGQCPSLIAGAIDDFIDSGVAALLSFTFS